MGGGIGIAVRNFHYNDTDGPAVRPRLPRKRREAEIGRMLTVKIGVSRHGLVFSGMG
jgi:hypothetical protein